MSFIACAQPKCSYLLGTCASRHVVAVCQSLPHFSVGAINEFALEQDPGQGAAIQSLAQAQRIATPLFSVLIGLQDVY